MATSNKKFSAFLQISDIKKKSNLTLKNKLNKTDHRRRTNSSPVTGEGLSSLQIVYS